MRRALSLLLLLTVAGCKCSEPNDDVVAHCLEPLKAASFSSTSKSRSTHRDPSSHRGVEAARGSPAPRDLRPTVARRLPRSARQRFGADGRCLRPLRPRLERQMTTVFRPAPKAPPKSRG